MLPTQFDSHCALTGNGVGIVKRMDKGEPPLLPYRLCVAQRGVEIITVQNDFTPQCTYRIDLDGRRCLWHDDNGPDIELAGGQSHTLGMIASRCRNNAWHRFLLQELVDAIKRTTAFERKNALLIFALEQDLIIEALG